MMENQIIQGIEYQFNERPEFRCGNCMRVTISGSCGCKSPDPIYVSDTWIGTPVSGKIIPKNELEKGR